MKLWPGLPRRSLTSTPDAGEEPLVVRPGPTEPLVDPPSVARTKGLAAVLERTLRWFGVGVKDAPPPSAARVGQLMTHLRGPVAGALIGASVMGLGTGAALAKGMDAAPIARVEEIDQPAQIHVVQKGESLSRIALAEHVLFPELVAKNPEIKNLDLIYPGQKIVLPTAHAPTPVVHHHRPHPPKERRAEVLSNELPRVELPRVELPRVELPRVELPRVEAPAPAEATVVVAPGVEAAPAALAASAPAAVVAETASSPRLGTEATSSLYRAGDLSSLVPKILRSPAWRALTERTVHRAIPVDLGPLGLGEARLDTHVDGGWDDMVELHIGSSLPEGQKILWLKTEGTIALPGNPLDAPVFGVPGSITLKGNLRYAITRPYHYRQGQEDPIGLGRALAANAVSLPLTPERAAALEPGAKLVLEGQLEAVDGHAILTSRLDADAQGHAKLEIQKLEDGTLSVRLTMDGTLEAKLNHELADGRAIHVEASTSGQRTRAFVLDLSKINGKNAFWELVGLNPGAAARLAEIPEGGVRLESESGTRDGRLLAEADLLRTPADTLHGRVLIRDSRSLESHEHSRELGLDLGHPVAPDGSTRGPTVHLGSTDGSSLFGTRAAPELPLPRSLADLIHLPKDINGSIERGRSLSGTLEDTSSRINLGAERTVRMAKYQDGGRVVESGKLDGGIELKTKLGVKANGSLRYRLDVPLILGADETALPLDASRAAKLPEGASFELTREGTLGSSPSTARTGLIRHTGRLDKTFERSDKITVTRGAGSSLTVSVERMGSDTSTLNLGAGIGPTESTGVDFELSSARTARESRSFSLSLDLDNPAHRQAYEAVLAHEEARALVLAGNPKVDETRERSGLDRAAISLRPADWTGASLELNRRLIPATDGRIAYDEDRAAATELIKSLGGSGRWVESSGSFTPRLDHTVTGPTGLRHGASVSGLVQYSALVPEGGRIQPPLEASDALLLSRGSEFTFHLEGRVSGSVGYGVGAEWSTPGLSASASAGIDATHARTKSTELVVKRLGTTKVSVSLSAGDRAERALELAARLGIKVELGALGGDLASASRADPLHRMSRLVDDELNRRLAFDASASVSRARDTDRTVKLELDLTKPAGIEAYRALLDLRPDRALDLAGVSLGPAAADADPSAVSAVSESATAREEDRSRFGLTIFGTRTYLMDALRSDSTKVEVQGPKVERTDRSSYTERHHSLLGRDRDVAWDAVMVRTNADPAGKGFYRLTLNDSDPLTSEGQARSLLLLGESLRGHPADHPRLEEDPGRGISKLFGGFAKHGKTKAEIEAFFTEKGVSSLRGYDGESALRAYGSAVAHRQGGRLPSWLQPKIAAQARSLLDQWSSAESHLDGPQNKEQARVAYWFLTHRNAWEDAPDYAAAKSFAKTIERMAASSDPVEWNHAYADLGKELRFGFFDALDALSRMAGPDEVLVSTLKMKGASVDIDMSDPTIIVPK
ncbi:MAG: LysM peptidoglycan-binding domain-containing protein [Myxococcota bacterium]